MKERLLYIAHSTEQTYDIHLNYYFIILFEFIRGYMLYSHRSMLNGSYHSFCYEALEVFDGILNLLAKGVDERGVDALLALLYYMGGHSGQLGQVGRLFFPGLSGWIHNQV